MLELEDQINRLADAAFDRTSPVEVHSTPTAKTPRASTRFALAAVAVLVVGAVVVGVARETDQFLSASDEDPAVVNESHRFDYVSDPLSLDLDQAIAVSEQQRIASIGPLLSFDFDSLPPGWSAEPIFAMGIPGLSGPMYWQQVAITTPDRNEMVLNLMGPLTDGPADPAPVLDIDGDPIAVRGQPGRINRGALQWIEQDRVTILIVGGSLGADDSAEVVALAESLDPVMTVLDWNGGTEMASPGGPIRPDAEPLLSGRMAGTVWQIAVDDEDVQLLVGDQSRLVGGTPTTSPEDRTLIQYSIDPIAVPGGAVVYGRAPATVELVRLNLANATVDLPVVPFGTEQGAFAVPISDLLDPISVSFHGQGETILATISLADLPPYLGGAIGSGVSIAAD